MEIDPKDIIGYGTAIGFVMGCYYVLRNEITSNKKDFVQLKLDTDEKIVKIEKDMKTIAETHSAITNTIVRLLEKIENFEARAEDQWQITNNASAQNMATTEKIFKKFEDQERNILNFYRDNKHIFNK